MHKVYYIHTEENISKSQIQGADYTYKKKLLGIGTERTYSTSLTATGLLETYGDTGDLSPRIICIILGD